jgi:ribonucleoside-diphosphate reductase alpha chain
VNIKEPTSAEATVGRPAEAAAPAAVEAKAAPKPAPAAETAKSFSGAAMRNQEDAPPCSTCGSIMIRSGSCYKCANCGTTSGCA